MLWDVVWSKNVNLARREVDTQRRLFHYSETPSYCQTVKGQNGSFCDPAHSAYVIYCSSQQDGLVGLLECNGGCMLPQSSRGAPSPPNTAVCCPKGVYGNYTHIRHDTQNATIAATPPPAAPPPPHRLFHYSETPSYCRTVNGQNGSFCDSTHPAYVIYCSGLPNGLVGYLECNGGCILPQSSGGAPSPLNTAVCCPKGVYGNYTHLPASSQTWIASISGMSTTSSTTTSSTTTGTTTSSTTTGTTTSSTTTAVSTGQSSTTSSDDSTWTEGDSWV